MVAVVVVGSLIVCTAMGAYAYVKYSQYQFLNTRESSVPPELRMSGRRSGAQNVPPSSTRAEPLMLMSDPDGLDADRQYTV
jgi:hypothetical protein